MNKYLFSIFVIIFLSLTHFVLAQESISAIRFGSTDSPLKGLTISWNNSGSEDSIHWGYTNELELGKYPAKLSSSIIGNQFDFTFGEINPSSKIYYKIYDSNLNQWSSAKNFETAAIPENKKYSFTVMGDSRSYPEEWGKVSEAVIESDFTIFLGDIIDRGKNANEWIDWFSYGSNFIAREPVYHTVGNHDRDDSPSRFDNFLGLFTLPGNELYYSFNYSNAVFICLNSESPKDEDQNNWLAETLEKNKDTDWKFVFYHKPFYTAPSHSGEMDNYFDTWWKLFDEYGVDMIFNGHTHNYQRTKPINRMVSKFSPAKSYGSNVGEGRCQIVAGNAGAPISRAASNEHWWLETSKAGRHFCDLQIDDKKLMLRAIDYNGNVFDSLVINKSTPEILFRVDMRDITKLQQDIDVYVNLTDEDNNYLMTDKNNDGIYSSSISFDNVNAKINYLFQYKAEGKDLITEKVVGGSRSIIPGNENNKPLIVKFNQSEVSPTEIIFQVDVSNVNADVDVKHVYLNIVDSGNKVKMDKKGESEIYSTTLKFDPETPVSFYYSIHEADDNIIVEEIPVRCSVDGYRTFYVEYASVILPPLMFGECDESLPVGTDITKLAGTIISVQNENLIWPAKGSSPQKEKSDKLVDNNLKTKFLIRSSNVEIEIINQSKSIVTGYTMRTANDAPVRDPKSWDLFGFDESSGNWELIHSVDNSGMNYKRFERYKWTFDNNKAYSKYKLHITDVNGSNRDMFQLSELKIFGAIK